MAAIPRSLSLSLGVDPVAWVEPLGVDLLAGVFLASSACAAGRYDYRHQLADCNVQPHMSISLLPAKMLCISRWRRQWQWQWHW